MIAFIVQTEQDAEPIAPIDQTNALSQTASAALMLIVLFIVICGSVAYIIMLRNHFRRKLPTKIVRNFPETPDPWAEAGRRAEPDPDPDNTPDDDDPDSDPGDDDEDDGNGPTPPVPISPSLSASS